MSAQGVLVGARPDCGAQHNLGRHRIAPLDGGLSLGAQIAQLRRARSRACQREQGKHQGERQGRRALNAEGRIV